MTKTKRFIRICAYDEATDMYEVWCSDSMGTEAPEEGVNGCYGKCSSVLLANMIAEEYEDPSELVGGHYQVI